MKKFKILPIICLFFAVNVASAEEKPIQPAEVKLSLLGDDKLSLLGDDALAPPPMGPIVLAKSELTLPRLQRQLTLSEAIEETLVNQRAIPINILNVLIQEGIAVSDLGPFDLVCSSSLTKTNSHDLQNNIYGPYSNLPGSTLAGQFQVTKTNRVGTIVTTSLNIQKTHTRDIGTTPAGNIINRNNRSIFSLNIQQPLLRDFYYNSQNATFISDTILTQSIYYQTLYAISAQLLTTINAYWELRAAQELYDVAIQSVEAYTKLVTQTKRLISDNQFAPYEIQQPLAQLNQALAAMDNAQQTYYADAKALMIAIGDDDYVCCIPPLEDRVLFANDIFASTPVPDSSQILNELLCYTVNYRYDILAQAIQVLSTDTLLEYAKNQELPSVSLFMGLKLTDFVNGNDSKKFFSSSRFRDPQNDMQMGVMFSTPFCNYSAAGKIERYSSLKTQQILQTEQLQQNAIQQVKVAWRNHKSLVEQAKFLAASIENFKQVIQSEKQRVLQGLSTLFEFIQDLNQLISIKQQSVTVRKQIAQNIANIRHLTGTLLSPDSDLNFIAIQDPTTINSPRYSNNALNK